MNTYTEVLQWLASALSAPETDSRPITSEEAAELLENSEAVTVTRLPLGVSPATSHRLAGYEAASGWENLEDQYDLDALELVTQYTEPPTYTIETQYFSDGEYRGRWKFQLDDAQAVLDE